MMVATFGRGSQSILSSAAVAAVCVVMFTGCRTPTSIIRQRGVTALHADDQRAAFEHFTRAVHQDPTDWKSQYQMGKLLLTRGEPLHAQLALEQARALRPDHTETPQIIDHLAQALYQQGRYDSLHALLSEAATTFGASVDFVRQGDYLIRIEDVDGAKVAYLKAVHFAGPDQIEPYIKLAEFYEHIGDRNVALGTWKRAYFMVPGNRQIESKLREYGIVPGPTVGAPPLP